MPRGENRHSVLLSREENELVFSMIGPKCQSLATAVVQLFTTEGPAHSEWKKRDTGVLCLIKDNGKRTYFFRIYCLYRKMLIWEHEVYLQIEYKTPRSFLHTFEAEEYMTAFNFANEEEAELLQSVLIEKIEQRKNKREEKRQRALLAAQQNSAPPPRTNGYLPPPPKPEPAPAPVLPPKANLSRRQTYSLKSSRKKPKLPKLTKDDIGMPQDFVHISHVGWDKNKGFDVEKLPNDDLKSFFTKAGVSETQLEDEKTREFIYDFIETHGGIAAVQDELTQTKPNTSMSRAPPLPTTAAPPVPSRSPAPGHPPAPPSRAPPPPPARAVPPPPSAVAPRNPPPPRPPQRDSPVGRAAPDAAAAAAGPGAAAAAAAPAGAAAPRAAGATRAARLRRADGRARRAHGEHTERRDGAQESTRSEQQAPRGGQQPKQSAESNPRGRGAEGGAQRRRRRRRGGWRRGARRLRAGRGAGARAGGPQPRHPLVRLRRPQRQRRRRLGRLNSAAPRPFLSSFVRTPSLGFIPKFYEVNFRRPSHLKSHFLC